MEFLPILCYLLMKHFWGVFFLKMLAKESEVTCPPPGPREPKLPQVVVI